MAESHTFTTARGRAVRRSSSGVVSKSSRWPVRLRNLIVLAWVLLVSFGCRSTPATSTLAAAAVVGSAAPANARAYLATNVVILVIDGARQTEMWQDAQRKHIRRLADELAPHGVLFTGFRNQGPTYTNAGHTALTTGVYQDIENAEGSELPGRAGIFQWFLRSTGLPSNRAWVIVSKDKLAILGDTTEDGWHGRYRPSVWAGKNGGGFGSGYADDVETFAAAKTILAKDHPRLVLINFKEPDAGGHGGNWDRYLAGLEASDALAADLWALLGQDPFYRDHTAFFITHDHGRHSNGVRDGFVNHGDNCEGCRRIALLALGPDFKQGAVVPQGGESIDLPVTVAHILGFPLPNARGRELTELFP